MFVEKSASIERAKICIYIVYFLMIFEGVLRKWVAPSLSSFIFFIKDPFLLYVYIQALIWGFYYRSLAFLFFLFVSFLIILLSLFNIFFQPEGVVIYLYGVRNYIFYLPLIFVIPYFFDRKDFLNVARWSVILVIPAVVLSMVQYFSPPSAYINKGIADEGFVFLVAEGIVRPYGFFTFTMGHVLFVSSIFVFILTFYFTRLKLLGGKLEPYFWVLVLVSFSLIFFTTGSRSVYAYALLVVMLLFFMNLIFSRKGVTKKIVNLLLACFIAIFVFTFTDSFQIMIERNSSAIDSEGSPLMRALASLFMFLEFYEETPLFGHGVGSGTNAAAVLLRGSTEQGMGFLLAEDEWSRIVLELGYVVGGIFILFRIFMFMWLFKLSVSAYKQGEIIPILIFGFVGSIMLNGVMTMQGTVLAYGTMFSAFIVALSVKVRR